jgi:VWFA-related protein
MMVKFPFFLSVFVILILVYPIYLGSQQEKKTQVLQHDATVTLKLVQVYVTDKEGLPVKNLNKSDFVLSDNGIKQEITDFEKHILEEEAPELKEEKPVPTETPASRMNRKFFVLIDLDRVQFGNIRRFKETLFHFVDTKLKATDEIGFFTLSAISGLRLRQYLTTDHTKVREAIASLKHVGGQGGGGGVSISDEAIGSHPINPQSHGRESLNDTTDEMHIVTCKKGQTTIRPSGGERRFLDNMKNLAMALQYIPGNKYMLFFSWGYEASFASSWFFRELFKEMVQMLSNSGTSVFSINVEPGRKWADPALEYLSQATGGQHFDNIREYQDISKKIQLLTGNYYVLGYYIPELWDGKFHKIDVEVKREGCQVFTQTGYHNPLLFKRLSEMEKLLQLVDLALGEKRYSQRMMDFPMMILPGELKGQSHVTMLAEAQLDRMIEIIGENVEVITLIFDKESTIIDSTRTEMDLKSAKAKTVYFCTGTALLPGSYECRIVIRNLETGASAVASSTAVVQAREETDFQLFPPLLLKQEREVFYMPGYGFKSAEGKQNLFSLSEMFPVDTSQYAPYVERTLPKNTDVWASIRCAVPEHLESEISLSAVLFDKTMLEEIPVPLEIVREEGGRGIKTFFVKLRIPEVETDEYTFIFTAEHMVSGATSLVICDYLIGGDEKDQSGFREKARIQPAGRQ